jgi:2-methylcitrate dehydratase PrpD
VYFDDFSDARAQSPQILGLAEKVDTFVDEECDRLFPRQFPAVLRVTLEDGTCLERRVMQNRGGPDNPLSEEELRTKFRLNAEQWLAPERAEELAEVIMRLDDASSVDPLLDLARA